MAAYVLFRCKCLCILIFRVISRSLTKKSIETNLSLQRSAILLIITIAAIEILQIKACPPTALSSHWADFSDKHSLSVEPLLQIERSQLSWLVHVSRISQKRSARQVLLAKPKGKRSGGRPRTSWSDYVSDLAWSHLGMEPAELSELAIDNGCFVSSRGCCLHFPPQRKSKHGNEWIDKLEHVSNIMQIRLLMLIFQLSLKTLISKKMITQRWSVNLVKHWII